MLWDEQVSLYSGLGYNNNVLLSEFNPQGSGFFINGLEVGVTRLPLDGWKIVGAIVGDDIRYWHEVGTTNGGGTSREDSFIGSLYAERELPDGWQVGLEARGLYEDEVLDITTSLAAPATALVEGYGITGQPSLRKDLPAGLWLKLEMPVTRWLFRAPLDNYWEFGPVITAGCDLSERSDVSLSYAASYQYHDEWTILNQFGQLGSPQLLELFEDRLELAWHQFWDSKQRWRSSTRLVFAYEKDNGSGYFNEYEYQIAEDLRWQTHDWQIQGSAQIGYEEYPIQPVEPHDSLTLYRDLWTLSLEVQRRLYKGLKSYVKVENERAISNAISHPDEYNATMVSGGLRYEF
jgi:hypothetical protein